MGAPTADDRFHHLDALRAFALLLGVVFHAAESFEAGHWEWAIVDSSPSDALHLFRHASHSFRMEIFFLLSGFFARLLWLKRGGRAFAWNRFQRIFIPLVVGWFILYPILVFLWLTGAAKSGRWDLLGIPAEVRHLPPWQLTIGFLTHGMMFQKFDLTHLWFLHQLLAIYLIALPLRGLLRKVTSPSFRQRLDAVFQQAVQSPWRVWLFALPTVPMLLAMESWNVDTPKRSLWPHPPTTVLYGWFFACGWLLHRVPAQLTSVVPSWRTSLGLGLLLVLPTALFGRWAWRQGWVGSHFLAVRLADAAIYAVMMWAFVWGFMGLFVRFCAGGSAFWRYVADASYWVYLAHLPTVVALQIAFAQVALPWTVKFPLIVIIAFPLLFASYHLLVRSTFLGRQLNGRAYPFGFPWGNRAPKTPSGGAPGESMGEPAG